jgi:hypothetical protein
MLGHRSPCGWSPYTLRETYLCGSVLFQNKPLSTHTMIQGIQRDVFKERLKLLRTHDVEAYNTFSTDTLSRRKALNLRMLVINTDAEKEYQCVAFDSTVGPDCGTAADVLYWAELISHHGQYSLSCDCCDCD